MNLIDKRPSDNAIVKRCQDDIRKEKYCYKSVLNRCVVTKKGTEKYRNVTYSPYLTQNPYLSYSFKQKRKATTGCGKTVTNTLRTPVSTRPNASIINNISAQREVLEKPKLFNPKKNKRKQINSSKTVTILKPDERSSHLLLVKNKKKALESNKFCKLRLREQFQYKREMQFDPLKCKPRGLRNLSDELKKILFYGKHRDNFIESCLGKIPNDQTKSPNETITISRMGSREFPSSTRVILCTDNSQAKTKQKDSSESIKKTKVSDVSIHQSLEATREKSSGVIDKKKNKNQQKNGKNLASKRLSRTPKSKEVIRKSSLSRLKCRRVASRGCLTIGRYNLDAATGTLVPRVGKNPKMDVSKGPTRHESPISKSRSEYKIAAGDSEYFTKTNNKKTNPKHNNNEFKLPNQLLGKNEVRSTIKLEKYDAPQFEHTGFVWPFVKAWENEFSGEKCLGGKYNLCMKEYNRFRCLVDGTISPRQHSKKTTIALSGRKSPKVHSMEKRCNSFNRKNVKNAKTKRDPEELEKI